MNCKQARTLFPAADDGRLAQDRKAELDAHVSSCQDCTAARALESRLVAATGQLEAAVPRSGLAARITAQALAAEPAVPMVDRWVEWIRSAWPVAALGTAAAVALFAFYPAPEPAPIASDIADVSELPSLVDEDADEGQTLLALEDALLPLED